MDTFLNLRSLKTLTSYFKRYRKLFLWGTFFVFLSNLFAVIPGQLVRHAFDELLASIRTSSAGHSTFEAVRNIVLFYAGLVILMSILKGFFMFLMRQTMIVMSRHIEYDMKNDIYAHLQKLSLAYYRRHNTGDLMTRVTEDVGRVRMYTGPSIMYFIGLMALVLQV